MDTLVFKVYYPSKVGLIRETWPLDSDDHDPWPALWRELVDADLKPLGMVTVMLDEVETESLRSFREAAETRSE